MASPTTNLGMTYPARGGSAGTWDTPIDTDLDTLDSVIGGTVTVAAAGSGSTLTQTQANNRRINVTGVLSQNYLLTFPAIGGMWVVANNTTGAFTITAKVTGSSATVLTIIQAESQIVNSNGTDLFMASSISSVSGSLSVTGNFAVNTNKFTVNATTGATVTAGALSSNTTITAGTTIQAITDLSGATASGAMIATQAEQEAGVATNKLVTSGRQHFNPSAAKAWADFTIAGAVNAGYNVSSVTDTGTGDWTVNFTTAFSSTNYARLATTRTNVDFTARNFIQVSNAALSASATRIVCAGDGSGAADPTAIYAGFLGDI